jgi:hypothetical protein
VRTPEIPQILLLNGIHAAAFIPQPESMAADVAAGEPDFPQDLTTTTRAARSCAKTFALIGKER